MPPAHVNAGGYGWAAENRGLQVSDLGPGNPQLRLVGDEVEPGIHKSGKRDWSDDRNAILQVIDQVCIATREDDLFHGNGDVVRSTPRVRRIQRNDGPVGILQRNGHRTREERNRGDGANVEAANVGIAAHIEAVERRRHLRLRILISTSPKRRNPKVLRPLLTGINLLYSATGLMYFTLPPRPANSVAKYRLCPVCGRCGIIDPVVRKIRHYLAGDDAVQGIGAGDAAERQGLKIT